MTEDNLCDVLAAAVEAHGVLVERAADGLLLGPLHLPAYARIVRRESAWVQLDVGLRLPDGRVLIESCVGLGATAAEQRRDAFAAFSANALHVLLEALCDHTCEEQVERDEWRCGAHDYTAFLGPYTFRTSGGGPPSLPDDLYDTVQAALQAAPLGRDTHWFRLYYAQAQRQPVVMEVLLDNETWPDAERVLRDVPWALDDRFYSVRLFLVLRRRDDG